MEREELTILHQESVSMSDLARKVGYPVNGTGYRKLRKLLGEHGLAEKKNTAGTVYPIQDKICPVCGDKFKSSIGSPKEKQTCSHACANTHFRSGKNNPNFKVDSISYRAKALYEYGHICSCCEYTTVVDVHHIDNNRENNKLDNLIILCPNCHATYHRGKGENLICKMGPKL